MTHTKIVDEAYLYKCLNIGIKLSSGGDVNRSHNSQFYNFFNLHVIISIDTNII